MGVAPSPVKANTATLPLGAGNDGASAPAFGSTGAFTDAFDAPLPDGFLPDAAFALSEPRAARACTARAPASARITTTAAAMRAPPRGSRSGRQRRIAFQIS